MRRLIWTASIGAAALVGGTVTPAWAAADQAAPAAVGGFGVGDGSEAMMDERDGALSLPVSAGPLELRWDSRSGVDRYGLGVGWGFGLASIVVDGGIRVSPAAGGSFEADASQISGLAGYTIDDVRFSAVAGVLEAAEHEASVSYAYALTELGGATTYFNEAGDPVASTAADGARTEYTWDASVPHRLLAVTDADGLVTGLDWSDEQLRIAPGANISAPAAGSSAGGSWVIHRGSRGEVRSIESPVGARRTIDYEGDLVTRTESASGAVTEIEWQTLADQRARVRNIRVVDRRSGAELSSRSWRAIGVSQAAVLPLSSGWPRVADPRESSGGDYETEVSDGHTRVRTHYTALHQLQARLVFASGGSGEVLLQEQRFSYADDTARAERPADRFLPTRTEIVHRDASGASRSTAESTVFDEFGRAVQHTDAAGRVTETVFDAQATEPAGSLGAEMPSGLPVGLPVQQTTTAVDGLATRTVRELDAQRTAVVSEETYAGAPTDSGEHEWTRTGRVEYDRDGDGFITAERHFEQGGGGAARLTTRSRVVDLEAGTATITETMAAGTPVAVTTVEVIDLLTGSPLARTDPGGLRTIWAYDRAGRETAVTTPAGLTTRTAYQAASDEHDAATIVTRLDDVVTTEYRDALGRVVRTTDNIRDGHPEAGYERVRETREYPDPSTVRVTDAWGATTETSQDVFGRVVRTTAPTGVSELTRYDDVAGTVTTAVSPTASFEDAEQTTTRELDADGSVVATHGTRRDGAGVPRVTHTLDGLGRETALSDGRTTATYRYDAFGNRTTTTATTAHDGVTGAPGEPAALTTHTRYDERGALVQKSVSGGEASVPGRERELDELGRVVSETDQTGATTTHEYTVDGLPLATTTAYGGRTDHRYHPVTRRLVESETTSPIGRTVRTAYEHDPRTGAVTAVFDPHDRAATEIAYTYDAFGNAITTRYPDGEQVTRRYDAHGRLIAITDIADLTTEYEHDAAGLVVAAVQRDRSGAEIARVAYEYDPLARPSRVTRGNGVTTHTEYTSLGQIERERTTAPDRSVQAERDYRYDGRGNLLERTDRERAPGGTAPDRSTTTYTYDARDRLTSSTTRSGTDPNGEHALERRTVYEVTATDDVASSTLTETSADVQHASTTTEFAYGPGGEPVGVTTDGVPSAQEYDAAGNLVRAADGTTYAYDAANRPVMETDPVEGTVATGYWADGRRAVLAAGTGETRYYWNGADLINDAHEIGDAGERAAGEAIASYLLGITRHARTTPSGTSYYGHDRHGNVAQVTDANGVVVAAHAYTDFGAPLGALGADRTTRVGDVDYQPFGHAGSYVNPTRARTQHLEARTYDPARLHFTSRDPAPLRNRFAFANLNPITKVDPSGHDAMSDAGLGLAIAGLIMTAAGSIAGLAFTGGGALAVFGAVVANGFELTAASLEVVQASGTRIMSDGAALALGIAAFGVGLPAAAVGAAAARVAKRGPSRLADGDKLEDFAWDIQGPQFTQGYDELAGIPAKGTAPVSREISHVVDETRPPAPLVLDPPESWLLVPPVTPESPDMMELASVLHFQVGLPRELVVRTVATAIDAANHSNPIRTWIWARLADTTSIENVSSRNILSNYISLSEMGYKVQAWGDVQLFYARSHVNAVRDVMYWASKGDPEALRLVNSYYIPDDSGVRMGKHARELTMEQVASTKYDFDD